MMEEQVTCTKPFQFDPILIVDQVSFTMITIKMKEEKQKLYSNLLPDLQNMK